jgi:DNA-binding MarR family transcriptional regulator/GNAT superfamily N-acetyltransferase
MSVTSEQISRVRAFNRDYTRRIGVLGEGLLDSPYSLTEVRVMYEIAHCPGITAGALSEELGVDKGYMSRILKRFEAKKLVVRQPFAQDARRHHLRLTSLGKRVFAPLDRRSQEQVRATLSALEPKGREAVLGAMTTIQSALSVAQTGGLPDAGTTTAPASAHAAASVHTTASEPAAEAASEEVTLRAHQPGDMGWVIERHGAVYHKEYGWNREFEALVAEIAAEFLRNLDPARDRCWIAQRGGDRVGCIFLVRDYQKPSDAKLRLLLVDPQVRGLGLGRTLVAECVRFARDAGYRRVLLWTQENLTAARHLYTEAGFTVIARSRHHSFGRDLVAETWELVL